MSGIIVVGAQWGDEGKGKLVDVFAEKSDFVVRFQGGANAGHTLVVDGVKTVLHLIPSGVLHSGTTCVIAAGVVLDLEGLVEEIKMLKSTGYLQKASQLIVSESCALILPVHKVLDKAREASLTKDKIGTTGKGIGPAYEDRASRRGLLLADIFDLPTLKEKVDKLLIEKNWLLEKYGEKLFSTEQVLAQISEWAKELAPYKSADVTLTLHKAIKNNKRVIFEGAQGTLLDVLHGTYPFVTSSSTIAGSACSGTGLGPTAIDQVIGVFKAYATRVGSGPFPTELADETGEKMRTLGKEFGATTGRARRCGWLDLVALKYAIRLNGLTNLALMKLDILSGFEKIAICTGYKVNGEVVTEYPVGLNALEQAEPILEWFNGWSEDISRCANLKDLPRNATTYIDYIGAHAGVPIDVISVGPGREQTLWVKPLFNR